MPSLETPCRRCGGTDRYPSGECRPCKRAAQKRLRQTPGTYAFNAVHGIGEPGKAAYANARRARRTPGTYQFKRTHGLGAPGQIKRAAAHRRGQTSGTHEYNRMHGIGEMGEKHRLYCLIWNTRRQALKNPELEPMLAEIEKLLQENGYAQAKRK